MKNVDHLKTEYHEQYPLYSEFCRELVNQLNFLLNEKEIHPGFPIEYRVKTIESILEKIERNDLEINSVVEMNDFAGIRIICLFYKDLELVEEILNENLIIHKTENTANRLGDNVFGYESIHFEVSPKSEWLKIPTFKKHANCKVEIQLRTASQHIWAAVSHTLQYKKESDIPFQLRRTINRSAALLETVDLEFERVQNERNKYLANIGQQIEDLNIDTLKSVLDSILPTENRRSNEPYSSLLQDVLAMGVKNAGELKKLLEKHIGFILEKNTKYIEDQQNDKNRTRPITRYYHSGLTRIMLQEEFKKKYDDYIHRNDSKTD